MAAGRKLRLQIQQSEDHGECGEPRVPRWHGDRAITTNDITGSVMKILITDSEGKRISITIGKNGGIRGVNKSEDCEVSIEQNNPENGAQIIADENNILSHLLVSGKNQGGITGTEINLEPNLECVKTEVRELDELGRESSNPFREVLDVISEGYNLESLEPEMEDEFHMAMEKIKSEELNMAGNFETVYVNGAVMLENDSIPKLEEGQAVQKSSSVFESTNYTKKMLCRLCAAERKDMINIFGEDEAYKNILEKIENCLSILVKEEDPLPNQVCRLCLEKLELCHKFRTTVVEAEQQFIMLGERELEEFRNEEENIEIFLPPSEQAGKKSRPPLAPKIPERPKQKKKENAAEDIIFVGETGRMNTTADEINDPVTIKCRICGLCFGTAKSCCAHSVIHSTPNDFPCSMCERVFTTKSDSLRHSVEHIEREFQQILNDNMEITTAKNIVPGADSNQSFSEQVHGQDIIKCRICGMYFGTGKSCYQHSEVHFSQKYYPCSMCNLTFDSRKLFHKHSFQHTARKAIQRRAAMYKYVLKSIAEHVEQKGDVQGIVYNQDSTEQNEDRDMVKCRICGLLFGSGRSCFAHSQVHYSFKNYPCSMCDKTFTTRAESFKHSVEHTTQKYVHRKATLYENQGSTDKEASSDEIYCPEEAARKLEAKKQTLFRQMQQQYDIIKCQICGTYFGTPKSCFLHSETHYLDNHYPCCMCDKIFTTKVDIRRHSFEHTERKPHKRAWLIKKHYSGYHLRSTKTSEGSSPSNCTEKVAEIVEVQEATNLQSDQSNNHDMVKCLICGLYFSSAKSCYVHSKVHATEAHLPCSMCDKIFTNEKDSCEHSEEHIMQNTCEKTMALYKKTLIINRLQKMEKDDNVLCAEETVQSETSSKQSEGNNPLKCRICGMEFRNAESCHLHSSVHVENNYYPCTMCNKIFPTEKEASEHNLEHTMGTTNEKDSSLYICYLCGERCPDKNSLEIHKIDHNGIPNACSCEKCGKSFISEPKLRSHMLYVHKEHKQYNCMICGKKFRSVRQLRGHQAKHADLAYECSWCRRRFVSNENLKLHKLQRCHSVVGDKNYSCLHCGLTFLRSWSLAKHVKKHTGEHTVKRHFNCNICESSFCDPSGLKEHQHTHSEHRPYGCLMCDKTFKSLKLRKDHMRAVHLDDKRYKCDICGRKFMRPSTLLVHKRTRHEMK